MSKTKVVFRRWKSGGSIIALFPEDIVGIGGEISSYMHVGQHSGANYHHVMAQSEPAIHAEYKSLKLELEMIGYCLDVRRRYSRKK